MMVGKRLVGVLNAESCRINAFSEDDQHFAEVLAAQAATAIRNTHLYESVQAVNEIGQKLTSGIRLKEDEIVNLIYEQTRDLTGAQDMYIALFDEETNLIRFSLATEHGKQVEYDSREADMDKRGKTEEVIFTGQPILHRTQEEAEAWYREPGHKEFIGAVQPSYLGVPMIAGKKKLGIIALSDWEHEYAYDEQDLKVLISMADQAAIALDNARLYYDVNQDLEERLEELETIQDIIRAINSEQDIGELIKRVAQETRALFNADDAVVYQYDQILKEFFQQIKIGEREHRQPQPDGSSLAVIDQGKIVFADDAESHPILGKSSFTRKYGVKSCIAAPLQVADECVGVLFVNYYDKLHHFTKDEKRIMRIIADQAALAIQTAGRLYNTNLQLETVLRSVEGARECKSLDELLQNYLRSALDAIDAESGVVQLLDQESDELVVRAVYGNVLERKYQRIPIDKGVTGRSIQKEEMVYVPDVRKDPDYLDFFPRTRSELAVPLMVKNEPLGVLNAEHSLIDAFDVNKRRLFELFSTQASVMIQERKQLELAQEQRIQSEIEANAAKMTQLMAHNMKNYLGGARSDLDDIIKQIELADDQKGTLERIDASMARCIDITMGLFKPYRPGKVVEQTPLLLVGNAVDHVKQITEISIKNQVPKDLPKIRIEANNAVDFFHEILTNAIKAVRKRIDAGEIQKGFVKIDGKISDTGHVKLLFTNNGPAIPIDQRAKIFERFSGEPDQRDPNNLGLGLWGARTFFKRQGGNVRLLVSDESHTTFEVTIPSVSALGVRQ
jgi:GAF domain-containing protein